MGVAPEIVGVGVGAPRARTNAGLAVQEHYLLSLLVSLFSYTLSFFPRVRHYRRITDKPSLMLFFKKNDLYTTNC